MNVFDAVKRSVTARQAAETYGIKVNRNGMAVCPFHDDRHPSLKVDRRFHCFGCQADGSVIDFVMLLFGLSAKEAAEKLAADFSVDHDRRPSDGAIQERRPEEERRRSAQTEEACVRTYLDYLSLLNEWRENYAPMMPDMLWHPRFVEALDNTAIVEYRLDTLLFGTAGEKAELVAGCGKEVTWIAARVRESHDGRDGCNDRGG